VNTISEQLKSAREKKQLSVNDIAALTHINRRYIASLEEGNFEQIPKAYLRSFIRTYAKEVGISPETLFRTEVNAPSELQEHATPPPVEQVAAIIAEKKDSEKNISSQKKIPPRDMIKGTVLFAALLGVVFLVSQFNVAERVSKKDAIPFDEVFDERALAIEHIDSLRLSATATESVWLIVKIDGKQTTKSILEKNESATWSAKNKFSITASDAGKIQFTFNNRFIGALGKEGTILRNSILDKEILNRFDAKGNVGTLKEEKEDSSVSN
jgi:cytoskeletal protein RodZ